MQMTLKLMCQQREVVKQITRTLIISIWKRRKGNDEEKQTNEKKSRNEKKWNSIFDDIS